MQLDLDGFQIPYTCKKCGKCFATMKQSSRHHAAAHRKHTVKVSINFALENYCLVSTKEVSQIVML